MCQSPSGSLFCCADALTDMRVEHLTHAEEVTLYFICGAGDHCSGWSEAHHMIVTVSPQLEQICEVRLPAKRRD